VGQAEDSRRPGADVRPGGGKRADTVALVGSNLATLPALTLSIALAASMGYRAVTRALARPGAPPAVPGDPAAVPAGPAATE